jgi:hypothetical protein
MWLALLGTSALLVTSNKVEQVCSWEDKESCTSSSSSLPSAAWQKDPHLKPMIFSLKDDPEEKTFEAYILTDIATYYNKTPGTVTAKKPSFTGMFGKFINLSPNKIRVYWQPTTGRVRTPSYISDIAPFGAAGTATYPGHEFIVVDANDPTDPSVATKLVVWTVKTGHSLYSYDPYGSIDEAAKSLSETQLELYKLQVRKFYPAGFQVSSVRYGMSI